MSGDFLSIDIILFAMIAIFLALRLRNALGRRDGNDSISKRHMKSDDVPPNNKENVIELPNADTASSFENDNEKEQQTQNPWDGSDMEKSLAKLTSLDSSFSGENFIVGARVAFEMVLTAFASGDKVALKKLLSTEVAANFFKVMKEREASGHVIADTLVGIKTSEMVEVYLEGSSANITVKFVSEQIKVTYDDDGNILEGSPKTVITVADFWTFSRDINTNNPNWILIATRSLD